MNSLILKLFILVILVKVIYSKEYPVRKNSVYELLEGQEETIFTCRSNGAINFIEKDDNGYSIVVVNQSRITSDRFTYSNRTRNDNVVHSIKLKNVDRSQDKYRYMCVSGAKIREVLIHVYYKTEDPICITNFYTKEPDKPVILQCIYKDAYPTVNIKSILPSYSYGYSTSYYTYSYGYDISSIDTSNGTHKIRTITISEEFVEDISMFKCEIYQSFPRGVSLLVEDVRKCYFDSNASVRLNSDVLIYISAILTLVYFYQVE